MGRFTEAMGETATELKETLPNHRDAAIEADGSLELMITMFAGGVVGNIESEIRKLARNPKAAQHINAMTMNATAEGFLTGLIFGLKMAEIGIHFKQTPEGLKLHTPERTKH